MIEKKLIIFENLSFFNLFYIFKNFYFKKNSSNYKIFYIYNSKITFLYLKFYKFFKINISKLDFDYYEIKNTNNTPYHLLINYYIRDEIIKKITFDNKLEKLKDFYKSNALYYYLIKSLANFDFGKNHYNLHRKLFLINVASNLIHKFNTKDITIIFESIIFEKYYRDYAKKIILIFYF